MSRITREKLDQAVELVQRSGLDLWLTFVRETAGGGDPALPLILDGGLTWQSALMVDKSGQKLAIVGHYDAEPIEASGDWDEVIRYHHGIGDALKETVRRLAPRTIGVNYSRDNDKADGITHGMLLLLKEYLGDSYEFVSAEEVVTALRSVKTAGEVEAMREAIEETHRLFREIEAYVEIKMSEMAVWDFVHRQVDARGMGYSWDSAQDPIVNSGPNSMAGHGMPSEQIRIEEGHIFHVDLGVTKNGYSSDLQRSWYVGGEVPEDVNKAFAAVIGAIDAGAATLRPGVEGWQVDEAARTYLVSQGYPEYMHAFGHQVGRKAHDGGSILGPRWERYGRTPYMAVEVGHVYTMELGVDVRGRGYLGVEEMVLVAEDGPVWLSQRQTELGVIR